MTDLIAACVVVACLAGLLWCWWFFLWMTWGSEFFRNFPDPFFWRTCKERRKP